MKKSRRQFRRLFPAVLILPFIIAVTVFSPSDGWAGTVRAFVVALDQPFFFNRLGAVNPNGMIYALAGDLVPINPALPLGPGNVMLRQDKRPRPIVLRMNVGDTLVITFDNFLGGKKEEQPATRNASVHVMGMELVRDIGSDGSNVGQNPSSLTPPGGRRIYRFAAEREGTYLLYNGGAILGGEGNGGSLAYGLFGAVQVEPPGAEWYRSQVTREELLLASTGFTGDGHPITNYDAVYPPGHRFAGLPILKMYSGPNDDRTLVHSDLNAIITGPGRGYFNHYPSNPVYEPQTDEATPRSRNEPFREFSVIFHDESFAIQAFPTIFNNPLFIQTLQSVRDGFAINYGSGGLGSELLANRLGVGPMGECVDCKYEEFFLTSWAVGDPATVVDIPANASAGGPVATKALYPDDVSNVFSSYIGDHVKIRNLHAGPKEHHLFHLHTHQWLFTPDDDKSTYLDSQLIGPGSGYTYEIAYNGSGNRNQTPGDAIFHCHFYPHFAQGMWALWRNHDVFEMGTELEIDPADGLPIPVPGSRALPDGEIAAGIPIPAIVPLPHRPMAPMPGPVMVKPIPPHPGSQVSFGPDPASGFPGNPLFTAADNPGYPFFIPGFAGHRPPHPPLDTIDGGGLPRHVIIGGTATFPALNRFSFHKVVTAADALELPETGTPVETVAMGYHAERFHDTFFPNGIPAPGNYGFRTNGLPPQPGAPFADPCISDLGESVGNPRLYKVAAIQLDAIMSKVGWHFPQSRILALWEDLADTLSGAKPPEPLFIRANTNDCIEFWHTNVIPHIYEHDDFQVQTPTDVIGQHIHLVKFDVTASDGAANGWNYEDGSFGHTEVIERINAINAGTLNGNADPGLIADTHPLGFLGAQITVQRWYADNLLDKTGKDRTLGTVFTHDHLSPSTHQQAGLYASLVVEPEGSTWWDNEEDVQFGTRDDGGPTSWAARIHTADPADSYREFLFQIADFQLAYQAGAGGTSDNPVPDPEGVINPPAKENAGLPFLVKTPALCLGGVAPPCPEAISVSDVGTFSVNYRTEPVPLRVLDPALADGDNPSGKQALGLAGDLAHVYRSNVMRGVGEMNSQPPFYPPLTGGLYPGDPFTPMMRVYENDKIHVRVHVGATEEGHVFNIHGAKWLQEPYASNSGYRNAQGIGISEHFEMVIPGPTTVKDLFNDYLYQMDGSAEGQWNGVWGIMRAYNGGLGLQPDLQPLPSNPKGFIVPKNKSEFQGICPNDAPVRKFDVTAVAAAQALPLDERVDRRTLVYNDRVGLPFSGLPGPLNDPTAILYVPTSDLKANGRLKRYARRHIEPLVLRANAGDCIEVTLRNRLPETLHGPDPAFPLNTADLAGYTTLPFVIEEFNANQVAPSSHVGLHAQLVDYHVFNSDGANVGFNPVQTAPPGGVATYRWYAGNVTSNPDGSLTATPVELGATNLMPADPIKQAGKGLIGALIIEPQGSTWITDAELSDCGEPGEPDCSRASATVKGPGGETLFREFVLLMQSDVNLKDATNLAIRNLGGEDDVEDTGHKAFNYRTEPMWFRFGYPPHTPVGILHGLDFTDAFSNVQVGGDPQTPLFYADAGTQVRFRVLMPGGHARNGVFQVHGHAWEREPYILDSTVIGHNPWSQWIGAQEGIGAGEHFDVVLKSAGGMRREPGDYLYRDQMSFGIDGGLWGIMRVE